MVALGEAMETLETHLNDARQQAADWDEVKPLENVVRVWLI